MFFSSLFYFSAASVSGNNSIVNPRPHSRQRQLTDKTGGEFLDSAILTQSRTGARSMNFHRRKPKHPPPSKNWNQESLKIISFLLAFIGKIRDNFI
jgi:hypothetical protein